MKILRQKYTYVLRVHTWITYKVLKNCEYGFLFSSASAIIEAKEM